MKLACFRMLPFLLSFVALPEFAQNIPVDPDAPTHDTKSAAGIDREWQTSVAKYDGARAAILRQVDLQSNDGPYRADWDTAADFRFTQKGDTLYAIEMAWPADGHAAIHSLGSTQEAKGMQIMNVELVGSSAKIEWRQTEDALEVKLPAVAPCKRECPLLERTITCFPLRHSRSH
jgi:hypothetical protein